MALPNSNISVAMVKAELGAATNDVGRLCIHPNINKWSRWKPVRHSTVTVITAAELANVKSGLEILEFTNFVDLLDFYRLNDNDYKFNYQRPRGGSNNPPEPYRLGDFRNYEHAAFRWYSLAGLYPYYFGEDASADFTMLTSSEPTNISWQYLELSFYHYGVIMVPVGTSSNERIGSSSRNFTEMGPYTAVVDISGLPNGDYDLFGFVCRKTSEVIDRYVPIEGGFLGTAQIRENKLEVEMTGIMERVVNRWDVRWGLTIENFSQTQQTLENCVVELRYSTSTPGSTLRTGERRLELGTIQIPGGQSYENLNNEFSTALDFIPLTESSAYLYFGNTTNTALNSTFGMITPAT